MAGVDSETTERIALVTGANKGIGFEIARQLGRRGMTIYVAARDRGRGSAAAGKLQGEGLAARFIELDVLREETIRQAAATIEAAHSRLDVLVNNAGIAEREDGLPSQANLDAVRRSLNTNFVGPAAVAQAMLPLHRQSSAGRIVNVSSELGSLTLNGDREWEHAWAKFLGYSASKAALNMLTVQLAFELRDTPIKVNSAGPGYCDRSERQPRHADSRGRGRRGDPPRPAPRRRADRRISFIGRSGRLVI
jgi:NAD(P)-dependent dehydrogenase (short-subunit alcohol dehydrogenase family)